MDEIISHFSVKSLTSSVSLPVHEPISFGFEDMVRAKAKADAVINAEIERRLIEMSLGLGKGHKGVSNIASERSSNEAPADTARSEYIYDLDLVAELSEIKRKKNRR